MSDGPHHTPPIRPKASSNGRATGLRDRFREAGGSGRSASIRPGAGSFSAVGDGLRRATGAPVISDEAHTPSLMHTSVLHRGGLLPWGRRPISIRCRSANPFGHDPNRKGTSVRRPPTRFWSARRAAALVGSFLALVTTAPAQDARPREGGASTPLARIFPQKIDSNLVPRACELAALLFPGSLAAVTDEEGVEFISRGSFPSVASPGSSAVLVVARLWLAGTPRALADRQDGQAPEGLARVASPCSESHLSGGLWPLRSGRSYNQAIVVSDP